MKYIIYDKGFLKQLKSYRKKHYNLNAFYEIVEKLANGQKLSVVHKDHALSGKWQSFRECHIEPDWLLIYRETETELILVATGSHDSLFR